MPVRAPMGSIWRPSDDTGSRDTDPSVFIQCVNGRETMANKLWSHGLEGLYHDIHTIAQVEIPPITVGEFITEYLTTNGRHIRIIIKLLLREAFNSLVSLKFGVVVCRIFPMLSFQLKKESGVVLVQLEKALVPLPLSYGVEPLAPVLITLRGVLFATVLHGVITAMNYCIAGALSACGPLSACGTLSACGASITLVMMVIAG